MKIWTDTLQRSDLIACADAVNREFPGCELTLVIGHLCEARKRAWRFDRVSLRSNYSRRWPNTGTRGADSYLGRAAEARREVRHWAGAASWTEWGWFLARVFERDPHAICNEYDGLDDFHDQTGGRFKDPRTPRERQIKRVAGLTV